MALTAEVLQLATTVAGAKEMRRVMVAQDREGLFELVLLNVAMRGEISTSGTSRNEVFAGEEGQRAGVVVVGEMYLG